MFVCSEQYIFLSSLLNLDLVTLCVFTLTLGVVDDCVSTISVCKLTVLQSTKGHSTECDTGYTEPLLVFLFISAAFSSDEHERL